MNIINAKALLAIAEEARELAYSPYSGITVGAALLTKDGKIFKGANIENASYTPTVCAERVAMFTAVHKGERKFTAMAIVGGKRGENVSAYCAPCGVCRQVMREFCEDDFAIYMVGKDGYESFTLADILPHSFRASTHMA